MSGDWLTPEIGKQLDRTLGFFPRVDSKASFVFAVDTAILAVMPLNLKALPQWSGGVIALTILTLILIALSLISVYRCTYPNLKGGARSLVYFREIAGMREAEYINAFLQLTEDQYRKEVLAQVWRNSEILTLKYDAIKHAFILTAVALIPWSWLLFLSSYEIAVEVVAKP